MLGILASSVYVILLTGAFKRYICGGGVLIGVQSIAKIGEIAKIVFATAVVSYLSVTLVMLPRDLLDGVSSATAEYCCGGVRAFDSYQIEIDRITLATETRTNPAVELVTGKAALADVYYVIDDLSA